MILTIRLDIRAALLLAQLEETGLYGDGLNEVATHLVLVGLQNAVDKGFIGLPPIAVEDAEEPVSAELDFSALQEPAPKMWKCSICEDGSNPFAMHDGGGCCLACGFKLDIPF